MQRDQKIEWGQLPPIANTPRPPLDQSTPLVGNKRRYVRASERCSVSVSVCVGYGLGSMRVLLVMRLRLLDFLIGPLLAQK
jgi:hypothetical protein